MNFIYSNRVWSRSSGVQIGFTESFRFEFRIFWVYISGGARSHFYRDH